MKKEPVCSFCGKTQTAVMALICGPGPISICDECVVLCVEILVEGYGDKIKPRFEEALKMPYAPEAISRALEHGGKR